MHNTNSNTTMTSETNNLGAAILQSQLHDLCIVCNKKVRSCAKSSIHEVLPKSDPPIKLFEVLKLLSNFAHLNQDECPLSACGACVGKAIQAYSFQRLCNKSVEFIRNCIPHVDESNHTISKFPLSENNHQEAETINNPEHNVNIDDLNVPTKLASVKIEILSSDDENNVDNGKDSNDIEFVSIKQESNMQTTANRAKQTTLQSGKEMVGCIYCHKNIPYEHYLLHKQKHTEKRPYACKICGKNFESSRLRRQHVGQMHMHRPFVCHLCGKRFIMEAHLIGHTRRAHKHSCKFSCNICGKSFIQESSLKQHRATHIVKKYLPRPSRFGVQPDLKHQLKRKPIKTEPMQ
ncbi:zinc finger protein 572-like [Atheta coriaria]|uniref:zinc finger protein 572-like n=1 Tax=Dalotia coriaria TaxID=877792 RepID=UPI0031F3642C